MHSHSHLAIDLGAESGRVVRGTFADGRVALQEINRFPTGMVSVLGHKHWNLLRMYEEMLKAFAAPGNEKIQSLGVDTWGVDFVLLGANDQPLGLPFAYRDSRTDGMMEKVFARRSAESLYAATGIQFMKFNTLFQLYSMAGPNSPLASARAMLMIPDYFHYLFTGSKSAEYTNATTTQCLNVRTGDWDRELLAELGIPTHFLQKISQPGSVLGELTQELRSLTNLPALPVIAPATHDTGSAVAAVPAQGDDWAYISSGTWSLVGIETPTPVTTPQAQRWNFTNEGGVNHTIRLLKNVVGLWLVQQLRAGFDTTLSYAQLTELAAAEPPFAILVDPDDGRFLNPPSMPRAFEEFCRETGQPVPQTPGAFVRCALDSLAMQYRLLLQQLAELSSRPIRRIHIIGGGSQNGLLCQLTADACNLPVLAGPVEGTALGNLMMQAIAAGHLRSVADARAVIRNSFDLTPYEPRPSRDLDPAWQRFLQLKAK